MPTIDEFLTNAAERGELNYFTVFPLSGKHEGYFKVKYGIASTAKNFEGVDRNPAKAAQTAFAEARKFKPTATKPLPKKTPAKPDGSAFG